MRTLAAVPALLIALQPAAFPREPVRARHGMVVAEEPLAADVGVAVLRSGGNAVDAAIAVGFALAVTHPFAGNIGGGGFMLIRFADGRSTFIDFRERAPGKAARDMYLDASGNPTKESYEGWRSSGVPGTVRGLELAHAKYGSRKWADLLAPAIDLAQHGFPVSYAAAESFRAEGKSLAASPESKRIFLNNGAYFKPGEILRQPELSRTLARIARNGAPEFYQGETARIFAEEMARHGGLITEADLRDYKALERKPLEGEYRGYHILSAPPPSSGGIGLLQMLGMLEGSGYERSGAGSAASIHYVAEVMRRFFADRSQYLGDPDATPVPVASLLDPAYIRQRRATIDPARATPSAMVLPGLERRESAETTHYNVVDAQGNAVAVTYTINLSYGNGITVPRLGFLLNNEMDDFSAKPGVPNAFGLLQGKANAIAPGKRPLSAMTPTMITRDGNFFMALGAPGGPRIITAVLQVILNVIDFGMNVQDAVDAPRFHHQWQPDTLRLERAISPDTAALLRDRGHTLDYSPGVVLARVEAILKNGAWLEGASDPRAAGKAAGY
jgi:gamma-glutamyltranspeptidase/glutathione hydrolase